MDAASDRRGHFPIFERWRAPRRQWGRQTELPLLILAIGLIAAAVAIPAWNDFTKRKQVLTGFFLADTARLAVEQSFRDQGPADMSRPDISRVALPAPTSEVQSLVVARDGTITVVFSAAVAEPGANTLQIAPVAGGKPFDLSDPANQGKPYDWECGAAAGKSTLPEKWRPSKCRPGEPSVAFFVFMVVLALIFAAPVVVLVTVLLGAILAPLGGPVARLRDELLATLAHPGALALGVAMLYPIGVTLYATFDDPRTYRAFHDAERARVTVTALEQLRKFPALWEATVEWTDASRTARSAQLEVGPSQWWSISSPAIDVGERTDILVSRSQAGATAWRKDPPRATPTRILDMELNLEALALASLFTFATVAGMFAIRAAESRKPARPADAMPAGTYATIGRVLDRLVTGFTVLIYLAIIVGAISYAAGLDLLKWLGVNP